METRARETTEIADAPVRGPGKVRRVAFYLSLVAFTLLLVFMSPLPFLVLGWFLQPEAGDVSHKVHEISFGGLFGLSLIAVLAQFRRPGAKPGAAIQAAAPILLAVVSILIVGAFEPFVVIFVVASLGPALLHPARRYVFRPRLRPSMPLLALLVVAAVPLATFAANQMSIGADASAVGKDIFDELPDDASDEEYEAAVEAADMTAEQRIEVEHYGHWSAMAAFALAIVAVGAIATVRIPGWRLSAWSAAIAVSIYAAASLTNPVDASAHGGIWGVAGLLWALAFVITAENVAKEDLAPRRIAPENPAEN